MYQNIVPLSKDKHMTKKVKAVNSYSFARSIYMTFIGVHEFHRASSIYPIVFIENTETAMFQPIALLGLQPEKNLFVDKNGQWNASYIPAIIRQYPFAMVTGKEETRFTICLDEQSEFISEDEGEPLFNEDGEAGDVIENIKQYLSQLKQMEILTKEFCQILKERNMFAPLNMSISNAGELKRITGGYMINEQRLNNIPDSEFLFLRKKNALPFIYNHLSSLTQIERLMKLNTDTQKKQIEADKKEVIRKKSKRQATKELLKMKSKKRLEAQKKIKKKRSKAKN
jgi:hypothetical protein